jgi:hypothetical protein
MEISDLLCSEKNIAATSLDGYLVETLLRQDARLELLGRNLQ